MNEHDRTSETDVFKCFEIFKIGKRGASSCEYLNKWFIMMMDNIAQFFNVGICWSWCFDMFWLVLTFWHQCSWDSKFSCKDANEGKWRRRFEKRRPCNWQHPLMASVSLVVRRSGATQCIQQDVSNSRAEKMWASCDILRYVASRFLKVVVVPLELLAVVANCWSGQSF